MNDPTSGLGPALAPWANLTAVASLIFFLGWILVRALPRILEAQQTRDKLFADSIGHVVARFEAQQQLQREHDERQTDRLEVAIWSARGADRKSNGGAPP